MNKIISKEHFSEKVFKLVIEAPLIAKSRKAGHFVIVRVGEKGERMPLTIAGADPRKRYHHTSSTGSWSFLLHDFVNLETKEIILQMLLVRWVKPPH